MKNIFCNFCGHAHTQDEVILSVLLKGFVSLMGVHDGAFGLSCINPECEKTFFGRANEREFKWFVDNFITNPFVFYPVDREHPEKVTETKAYTTYGYHVPSFYFDADNEIFTSYMIPYFPLDSHQETLEGQENEILSAYKNPKFNNFWCSFLPGFMPPVQPQSMAIWFNRKDLLSLLEIENFHRMRVFPRYIPINSHYEKAEQLSASHSISLKIGLGDIGSDLDEVLSRLQQIKPLEGIIIGNLKYAETSIKPETYGLHKIINELGTAGNQFFLDILTTDPTLFGGTGIDPFSIFLRRVLKVDNPFLDDSKPFTLTNIDYEKIDNQDEEEKHSASVKKIRDNSTTPAVQDWLTDNIDEFIVDYELISAYAGFSYAEIWRIIKRHVKRLSFHLDIELRKIAKYAFYKEGEYFTIIFNASDPVRIKEQIGLKYIHYLVLNRHEFVWSRHLENLGGIVVLPNEEEVEDDDDLQYREGKSGGQFDDLDTTELGNLSIRKDIDGLPDYKIDKKSIAVTLTLIKELKTRKKTERDFGKKAEIQKEIDFLNNYLGESTANKKPQPFSTVSKQKKTAIGNSIKNSLKSLHDTDGGPPIANHFKKFLSSLYSDQLRYSPTPDIDWHT
jgi:hypothetical protein